MKLSRARITSRLFRAGVSLLCVFSSTAQASWSGPVYAVSNRQGGRMDIAPTTPNSGDPWPGAVAGTVKATFTWVHDVPGDAPPSDVYVLQSGKAQWQLLGPPPAGAMSQPSASVQSVAFSFGRKPRIYLAQTQTVWGTADDGLGHAQVVTTTANGQTGTSQGYKPILCHPTGGTLVTSAVTLSASATSKQTYVASWSYSAQVMALQMTRNGVDITSPNKPEVPVMVGERNQMGVSVSPVPQGVAPPTFQWTLPTTDVIKDYIETAGNPSAVPPTPFTGRKVELPAGDSTTQSPHFYWYNATFAGDSKEVSVVVTIAGTPITIKGKCKVYRPKFNSLTGTYTKERPQSYSLGGSIQFGNPGVRWNATVQTPTVANAAGSIAFEQKVTFNFAVQGHSTGTPYSLKSSATDALDSASGNVRYGNSIVGITAGSVASTTESDNPALSPETTDETMQASGSFKTYLVYKPSSEGSIWVVLGKLDWSFAFSALYKNDDPTVMPTWIATTTSPTDTTTNPIGSDTYDLPEWSMRGQDAKWTKVTP